MSRRKSIRVNRIALVAVFSALVICTPAPAEEPQVVVKSNDQCYVCHMPFQSEKLAVVHAKEHVWCGTCHGPSIPHIEDENIGLTPPDIVHKKNKIDRMCGECHDPKEHTVLDKKVRSARLAEGEKAQRKIKRRKLKVTGVCTDCHGRHWIPPRKQPSRPSEAGAGDTQPRVQSFRTTKTANSSVPGT